MKCPGCGEKNMVRVDQSFDAVEYECRGCANFVVKPRKAKQPKADPKVVAP